MVPKLESTAAGTDTTKAANQRVRASSRVADAKDSEAAKKNAKTISKLLTRTLVGGTPAALSAKAGAAGTAGTGLRWEIHAGRVPFERLAQLMEPLTALINEQPLDALEIPRNR